MVQADEACGWAMKYRSVIGRGKAFLIDEPAAKREALDIIMGQYSDRSHTYKDEHINKTRIIKVEIEELTGKQSGY